MLSGLAAKFSGSFYCGIVALGLFSSTFVVGQAKTPALPDAPDMSFARAGAESESPSLELFVQKPGSETQATPGGPTNIPPPTGDGVQSKRILGLIPNFRAVNADVKLPPQSVKDKFLTATEDSFDYSSIVLPAAVAFESYERDSTPEFGSGGVGYGRYLWHSVVDQTDENYLVEFILPVLTKEDTRYYTLGHGGFVKRAGYSLSRILITRGDDTKRKFNFSEVVGAGAAAGVSTFYYPRPERTGSQVATQWGTSLGIDAFSFLFREFWPDVNHTLFHAAKP